MKRVRIRVRGLVQGVFFRASTQREATALGLVGIVRNEPDDSVTIEAEGEAAALEKLLEWCYRGPPRARVDRVEATELPTRGGASFTIDD